MGDTYLSNNEAAAIGRVVTLPKFSHVHCDETFYSISIEIPRLSETTDVINVMLSEKLAEVSEIKLGDIFEIKGQFRSYNNYSGVGNKLILMLFAKDINKLEEREITEEKKPNYLYLNGFICKEPVYRMTPFGREITDLLVAVNRAYGKSDYIPCIAWGRNAKFAANLQVGSHIELWGRIQSRDYQKKMDDGETIVKKAYEISISKIKMADENETESQEIL